MRRYAVPAAWILIVILLGGGIWFWRSLFPGPRDWTSQWPTFYRERFSARFKIPADAEIVSAIETPGIMMGAHERVVFRLPRSRPPAEWVSEIAQASGIGSFRQSDIWYDASHLVEGRPNKHRDTPTDNYLIRYRTEDETYEAIWGWD